MFLRFVFCGHILSLMRNRAALIAAVAAGQRPKYLFFWGHTGGPDSKACLSQWYPAPFEVDGVRYATAEHWMMVGKARLFEPAMIEPILAAPSPAAAKALGRTVAGFRPDVWDAHKVDIVVEGSVHKFAQNPVMGAFLAGTKQRVLVEAAPRDRIWGIGLGADNPKAQDPRTWRGHNHLGFALMEARARLAGA